jgi:hypothetical protein
MPRLRAVSMSAAAMASVWWAREISRPFISDSTASAAREAKRFGDRAWMWLATCTRAWA